MNRSRSLELASLTMLSALALTGCGGGGGSSTEAAAPAPLTDAQRISAAQATVAQNPLCSLATLGSYYWEIGDKNGAKVSGTVGAGTNASTTLRVYSSSKWLYAASVLQKHNGVQSADVPFLNFTSGYSLYTNTPDCGLLSNDTATVDTCKPVAGSFSQDPSSVGHFAYDTGHMQHHASATMAMGGDDNIALASDLNATIGSNTLGFSYWLPQLAAGVQATPTNYAKFLRMILNGQLQMSNALGSNKVCAWLSSTAPGCSASFVPDSVGTELWDYSLGHWVEDDPNVGDHAFSSAGGGGFYPWIDVTKTWYGVFARETETESAAGYHTAQCGRLVRQAWVTGVAVTSASVPTPGR